ncbi:glycosyltransferase [Phytomonospora sp. NPDC050363]|uniref:glycosyltransferase n=1 Tax=Phytomonospora sp. NPDC050363 TaxID=3155642 RepID=UPI0033D68A2C
MSLLALDTVLDFPAATGADRMRVLIATDTFMPDVNGAAYFTYRLAAGLAERGHDVHVVCPSEHGSSTVDYRDGITLHRLRSRRLPTQQMRFTVPIGLTDTVADVIDRVDPDVVHAQGHFMIGRATIRAARRAGVPVVATNHFMPDNLMHHVKIPDRLRERVAALGWRDAARVFSRADHVTTPTEIAARLFADKGFTGHVEAVSCGIDLHRFSPGDAGRYTDRRSARRRLCLPDRPTVAFVGRLDEEKRLHEAVEAVAALRRSHVDVQLALTGTGPCRDALAERAAELGVAEDVRFLGFVPDADLPLVYTAADVFVMPGVAELQSIATLEAMASGLPIVAADAVALPHLVRDGDNGFLYRPGDVTELTGHLRALLGDDLARRRMGHHSRSIAAGHDHQRSLARFEEIYAALAVRATR